MNTILYDKIEEAAFQESSMYNTIQEKNAAYSTGMKIAKFALQNQWISVEEGLPDVDGHGYSKPVLVKSDTNELLVATYSKTYNKWNAIDPVGYHRLVITHWMPIPSLKGGEE